MMSSTRIHRHVNAPRAAVYRAPLDARAIAQWKVPTGMSSHVHEFDPREGGFFRVSLTYDAPTGTGKTTAHTDTYHGRFVKLVPDEQVVESVEFETEDPAMRGEMTITTTLADADGGTEILAVHDGLPPGLSPADNEAGWQEALAKLAALVEAGEREREMENTEKKRYLEPTQESGRALVIRGIEGPVVMLNLLRFRGVADYSAMPELAPPEPISGEQAFQLYVAHTKPYLEASGGELVFLGKGGHFLIGPADERWDAVMLVRQRSIGDFMAFAGNTEYLQGIGHRTAALEDSRLLPIVEERA